MRIVGDEQHAIGSQCRQRRAKADRLPSRNFPVQRSIQKTSDDLDALNERIVELGHEGHRGHAMNVLKAKALDSARQIDELRGQILVPAKQRPIAPKLTRWKLRLRRTAGRRMNTTARKSAGK